MVLKAVPSVLLFKLKILRIKNYQKYFKISIKFKKIKLKCIFFIGYLVIKPIFINLKSIFYLKKINLYKYKFILYNFIIETKINKK